MKLRIFFVLHTLPQRELEKLRGTRKGDGKMGVPGQVKIRYNRQRCAIEREFPSVDAARQWAESQRRENHEFQGVWDEYATVWGICEAKDGEKCTELEGAFFAEEQELFSSEEIEAFTTK